MPVAGVAARVIDPDNPPVYRLADLVSEDAAFLGLAAGQPWGDQALTLEIAGGPYAFTGLSASLRQETAARFAPMVPVFPAVRPGALATSVRRVDPGIFRPSIDPHFPFELGQAFSHERVRLAGFRLVAELLYGEPSTGALGVARGADLIGMGDLENYLRVLVAYRLLAQGGVLLHSAGIATGAGAYLFIGRSGAGKTTLSTAALRAGLDVLSDDMNAVARDTPPRVHKLPFAGTLGQRIGDCGVYPLRAICWLHKGERLACAPLSGASAASRLAVCAPYVNIDPLRADSLLQTLECLAGTVPMLSLTFPREVDIGLLLDMVGDRVDTA